MSLDDDITHLIIRISLKITFIPCNYFLHVIYSHTHKGTLTRYSLYVEFGIREYYKRME